MTNKKLLIFDLQGTLVKKMRPPVLNGSLDSLYKLQKKNFIFALFTGATKAETTNIFKKLNLSKNLFRNELIITANNNLPKKPNPKAINNLTKLINPSKIYYLGNTKKDYLTAKNAKISFVYFGKIKIGILQVSNINDLLNVKIQL